MNNNPPILNTLFGVAKVDATGYYRIHTHVEGNNGKYLHRLIFEKFYGFIPEGFVIHHKNGNKFDNCILNLQLLENKFHSKYHSSGENHPLYGTKRSLECKSKISEKLSEKYNTSGFYRVSKKKDETCTQGFAWAYRYYDENGKRCVISSVNIEKLKEKILSKGLLWKEYKKMGS